jgi:hypothetical protein
MLNDNPTYYVSCLAATALRPSGAYWYYSLELFFVAIYKPTMTLGGYFDGWDPAYQAITSNPLTVAGIHHTDWNHIEILTYFNHNGNMKQVLIMFWDLTTWTIQYKKPFDYLYHDGILHGQYIFATNSFLIPLTTNNLFYRGGGTVPNYSVNAGSTVIMFVSTEKKTSCYCLNDDIWVQPRSLQFLTNYCYNYGAVY